MSDLSLLTFIGLGLLLTTLGAALKIGFWVWIVSFLTRAGRKQRRQAAAPAPSRGSGLDTTKKIVTLVAAILGIVSTTVGLVKDCSGDPQPQSPTPAYPATQPQPAAQPVYQSTTCCVGGISCPMMTGPQPLGTPCFCVDAHGNMAHGQTC